jgi:hypothetical protein
MQLSLNRDAMDPRIEMELSVVTGYDDQKSPIIERFSCSVGFFDRLMKRLQKLPKGNGAVESMGVSVELSQHRVHFYSTSIYGDSSKDEIEGITITLNELMLIPDEDLAGLTYIKAVSDYVKANFPGGESLTAEEIGERFPWIRTTKHIVFKDESIVEHHGKYTTHHLALPVTAIIRHFKKPVASMEELSAETALARRRHGMFDCYAFDDTGNELASIAPDGSWLTKFGENKYGDDGEGWQKMERDIRFLVLRNSSRDKVIIQEFELATAA